MREPGSIDAQDQRLTQLFGELLSNLSSVELTPLHRKWIDEYVDNFEYGVAFDILFNPGLRGQLPSEDDLALIANVSRELGLSDDDLRHRIELLRADQG